MFTLETWIITLTSSPPHVLCAIASTGTYAYKDTNNILCVLISVTVRSSSHLVKKSCPQCCI